MGTLTPDNITILLLSFGVLLATARILGEIALVFKQPAILGELLAGVLLGPTVLGSIAPEWNAFLFPSEGTNAIALEVIATLAITMFMLVAGMEVDLSTIWRQGTVGLKVGVMSMVIPFALGFAAAGLLPQALGGTPDANRLIFALFLATALSITALPIIAKTLMDLGLYRSEFGMVVVSAAIFNDLIGWIIFAVILGLAGGAGAHTSSIPMTIFLTLTFAALTLTLGRWLIHKSLPFFQIYTRWPGGVLSFALTLAMFGAAFVEWIGVHAIFGSFLVGVAVGDSSHLRERTRVIIEQFVSFIFAPVFFASIGLKVNFLTHFDLPLVLAVLAIACICKLVGGTLGARWGGMSRRDAWAIGFAMNARGAMEIILGLLALQAGLIRQRLFVALVVMAIVTSMVSGPAMRFILGHDRKRGLLGLLSSRLYIEDMKASSRRGAIHELVQAAAQAADIDGSTVESLVWSREEALPTGIGNGVAVPHARVAGLEEPCVVVGVSERGIDFDAPDDRLAHVIFLVLTPIDQPSVQLELVADIANLFRHPSMFERVLNAKAFPEFLFLLRNPVE